MTSTGRVRLERAATAGDGVASLVLDDLVALADPGPSYVVAEGYLLREIELANAELEHVPFTSERDAVPAPDSE